MTLDLLCHLHPLFLICSGNKLLQRRYIKYLRKHIELAQKEVIRTKNNQKLNELAKYYLDRYSNDLYIFKNVYNCDLISGFKYFQDIGVLEIITSGATHGYFPILHVTKQTVKAQIAVGVQTYEKYFGMLNPVGLEDGIKRTAEFMKRKMM